MMIQRKLPHPQSLEGALLHPQEVAVKSLIKASKSLFMVYTMSGGLPCFWKNKKFFSDRGFRRILCVYGGTALRDMLRYIEDSRWENADNDILKQTQKIVEMASQADKVGGGEVYAYMGNDGEGTIRGTQRRHRAKVLILDKGLAILTRYCKI